MASITIRHTHADGTLIEGSSKGDGVLEVLRGLRDNWRYFPSIRQIGLGQSRDKSANTYRIKRAAEALEAAGHVVTVEVDETQRRTFAEAEAERYERAEDRAERYEGYASNAAARSDAAYQAAHRIADGIPMGQPILVGHHSERRHRRDIERMHSGMRRSIAEEAKAEHYAERAETAERYQARRESVPTTLRRIEKLEAELRGVNRNLAGRIDYVSDGAGGYALKRVMPSEGRKARLEQMAADLQEQIDYWRGHIAKAEAEGVKIWSKADFAKGDFVQTEFGYYEVLRVNAKSVTIPALISDGPVVTKANSRLTWTDTMPYDKVKGRKSAEEMAAILAEADRHETANAG